MVACTPVTQEPIRAEVWMGDSMIATTPFVSSFNVGKSRGQLSTTCTVTVDVLATTSFPSGADLIVKAGTRGNLKRVFTGIVESTTTEPSFAKPSYFRLAFSARGVLSQLENKTFSRRLKSDGQGLFCVITGGSSNRPKSYTTLDRKVSTGNRTTRTSSPNPSDSVGENSPFVKFVGGESSDRGAGGAAELASKPTGGSPDGAGGSFRVHDHSDLDSGGPAFAVYSAD